VIEVYTSFWSSPELRDLDATMVSISRGEPRWRLAFAYRRLRNLAPNDEAWNAEDRAAFERAYTRQLEEIGAGAILDDLRRVGGGRPCVLLCWEKLSADDEYCHRLTLSRFLEREAGIRVPELKAGMLPQREGVAEPRLFS